jgi:hypothetical protein
VDTGAGLLLTYRRQLTLSRLGPPLDRHLALAIHIPPNNGLMDMIPIAKLVVDVLAVH